MVYMVSILPLIFLFPHSLFFKPFGTVPSTQLQLVSLSNLYTRAFFSSGEWHVIWCLGYSPFCRVYMLVVDLMFISPTIWYCWFIFERGKWSKRCETTRTKEHSKQSSTTTKINLYINKDIKWNIPKHYECSTTVCWIFLCVCVCVCV